MTKVKLGVAATRRNMFSREDAIRHKNMVLERLRRLDVDFVDIDWLNADGLLYDVCFVDAVEDRFKAEKVDALFLPHCNFGCEEATCKLAKRLGVPVMLWGPRDDAPQPDGLRLRDSQCGMFATSKVLQRMGVPFTYVENCWIDDPLWQEELLKFLRVAAVVKAFRSMKIGQIDTRPGDFWSVMYNEAELLEKFNIETVPYTLVEVAADMDAKLKNDRQTLTPAVEQIKRDYTFDFDEECLYKMAAMKQVIREWADKNGLSAIAVQCWNAMQDITGIMPCAINAMLTDEGLPVVCETDVCGAITAVLAQQAMGDQPIFFADVTVRHPTNDNAELLWHCGPFPASLRREGCEAHLGLHYTLASECPGVCEWELKHDEVTIVRFDGIGGKYSLLAAKGHGVDGPKSRGTYLWTEFKAWPALERKLMYGPYIHHVAGVYGDAIPVLEEALRYMPGVADDIVRD